MDIDLITNWAQILALPVAVAAILVSIVMYLQTRQRRALSCAFESPECSVEIKAGAGMAGQIEILYRGQKVSNLYVARATIRNTGNMEILASDFVEPLTFTFNAGVRLVGEPRTTSTKPPDLTTEWFIEATDSATQPTVVRVDLPLLNAGDQLTAEFVYTGDGALPTVSARIAGVQAIDLCEPSEAEVGDAGRIRHGFRIWYFFEDSTVQIIGGLVAAFLAITALALLYGTAKDTPPGRIVSAISGAVTFWAILANQLWYRFRQLLGSPQAMIFAFLLAFALALAFGACMMNWSFIDRLLSLST